MSTLADLTYVLPIRSAAGPFPDDLPDYLARIAEAVAAVIVVDGSPARIFAALDATLPGSVRHIPVDPAQRGANGKVAGVRTAMRLARTAYVVIADDDIRYQRAELQAVRDALLRDDVVRPQNYFEPRPWHAVLDEGRSLIARATGGDWPGTLGVRRATYERAGGYDADVLFENLELVRTIRAIGGTERVLDNVFVRRRPPALGHYLGQRVRQAYDEFARPGRFIVQLALVPALVLLARRYGFGGVLAAAGATMVLAEAGRRRGGATRVFPAAASLAAPVWVAERAVTSWLALGARMRGGVRYSHGRLRIAANAPRALRARLQARAA